MGLGPSLCVRCRVFHKYIADEQPGRQGHYVCPINQNHAESTHLFGIPDDEWTTVFQESAWVRFVEGG